MSLLSAQMRWAFDRTIDPTEELPKQVTLSGMPRETVDKVTSDADLKSELLAAQTDVEKKYNIDTTPTFSSNGKSHFGETTNDEFVKWLGGGRDRRL